MRQSRYLGVGLLLMAGILAGVSSTFTPVQAQDPDKDQRFIHALTAHQLRTLGPDETAALRTARRYWDPGTIADAMAPVFRPRNQYLSPAGTRFNDIYRPQRAKTDKRQANQALDCLLDPRCALRVAQAADTRSEQILASARDALQSRARQASDACLLGALFTRNMAYLAYPGITLAHAMAELEQCPPSAEVEFHQDLANLSWQAYQAVLAKRRSSTEDVDKTQ